MIRPFIVGRSFRHSQTAGLRCSVEINLFEFFFGYLVPFLHILCSDYVSVIVSTLLSGSSKSRDEESRDNAA